MPGSLDFRHRKRCTALPHILAVPETSAPSPCPYEASFSTCKSSDHSLVGDPETTQSAPHRDKVHARAPTQLTRAHHGTPLSTHCSLSHNNCCLSPRPLDCCVNVGGTRCIRSLISQTPRSTLDHFETPLLLNIQNLLVTQDINYLLRRRHGRAYLAGRLLLVL